MAEPNSGIFNLSGFQSEVRSTSALQVRIAYKSRRYEYSIRPKGDDWVFSKASSQDQVNSGEVRVGSYLDPYAVRREFEALDLNGPEVVARFLREAGQFWPWESIRLSQVKEWREFFRWLCLEPDEAKKTSEGEKAWNTASLVRNSFFAISDSEFTRDRYAPRALKNLEGSKHWQDRLWEDREILQALRGFAIYPASPNDGNQVRLHWYDPADWLPQQKGIPPENWEERHKKKNPRCRLEPYLRIHTNNVLEAIAATIYADRLNGQRFGKCKHCGVIFTIKSNHGQQFCSARPDRLTSSCKNAFLQHQRRTRGRKES